MILLLQSYQFLILVPLDPILLLLNLISSPIHLLLTLLASLDLVNHLHQIIVIVHYENVALRISRRLLLLLMGRDE